MLLISSFIVILIFSFLVSYYQGSIWLWCYLRLTVRNSIGPNFAHSVESAMS